jgi:hypothetical protein
MFQPLTAFSLPPAPSEGSLGINLNGPLSSWSADCPLWTFSVSPAHGRAKSKGKGWNQGPQLDLDEHGWIKNAWKPGCYAETGMCGIPGGHYPAGSYVCLYDGDGTIDFWNIDRVVSRATGVRL